MKRRDWDVLRKEGTPLPVGVEPVPAIADQHWTDPDWIASAAKDVQLGGAVKAMLGKVAPGAWTHLNEETAAHSPLPLAEMKNTALASRPEKWSITQTGFEDPTFSGRVAPAAGAVMDMYAPTIHSRTAMGSVTIAP